MADFDADFSAGTTIEVWTDPASGGVPTRLNAFTEHPHRRHVCEVGTQLTVTAVVGGVSAPLDAALGGRLFRLYHVERPDGTVVAPAISNPAGQSSVQRVTPDRAGHWTFRMKRYDAGGAIFLHVDARDP